MPCFQFRVNTGKSADSAMGPVLVSRAWDSGHVTNCKACSIITFGWSTT
ncbi:Uncharacterised protein [Mycobacteroides abscessus subsp. abscessus]|nr:Uncharacterised protein [Mycobacteroides abscessus subsp. abscessus]